MECLTTGYRLVSNKKSVSIIYAYTYLQELELYNSSYHFDVIPPLHL